MTEQTLDTSDLDQYVGKQLRSSESFEPVGNNDIRRWVQAMHYPNRLHYDRDYAAQSRQGQIIAPQSFAVAMDDGHGAVPACVGKIPNSHLIFGGDEWWFYGPTMKAGDMIRNERFGVDYVVKETAFAGPTCFQRGDNVYYNQDGDKIATQRSTGIRYNPDLAREMQSQTASETEPEWTDAQIADLEEKKFKWIQSLHDLGHGKRLFDSVEAGDELPTRVFGPHSIASLATEWRAFPQNLWGAMRLPEGGPGDLGWVDEMNGHEQDATMQRINPELTDGGYYGPSRGHLFPRYAQRIGMPRGYGYGASMGAYILDYLAGWAGEYGMITHCNSHYRGPVFTGDITVQTAEIVEKTTDEEGRSIVKVKSAMKNQEDTILATATASIALPTS